ncbi:MAG: redox-regulated ATPase YchF [Armatimonadetes bacterium]|nr:redox-regulated ATPase YchF [Armatimonadota bacterium]
MKVGIFGLPQSGKTAVFRVLAGRRELHDTHGEAQIAAVKLPDERLDFVARVFASRKATPAEIVFVDTAALHQGHADAKRGESLTALLGDADAFALVVRCFDLSSEAPGETATREFESLLLELALTDLAILDRRLERLEKDLRHGKKEVAAELELLRRCATHLEVGGLLARLALTAEEDKALRGFALLTQKPMLVVANVGEDDAGGGVLGPGETLEPLAARCGALGLPTVAFCAELEAEILELDADEQAAFLTDYGITEFARDAFVAAAFGLLGLVTFFTANDSEARAWNIPQGSTALEAAGKVHTDMARGFIRAEVIAHDDLRDAGSVAECRHRGTARLEGKEYAVRDGDILQVRFSV